MEPCELEGRNVRCTINEDVSLTVRTTSNAPTGDGQLLWESSRPHPPSLCVAVGDRFVEVPLGAAGVCSRRPFAVDGFEGSQLDLSSYEGADVQLSFSVGIKAGTDELLIQIEQTGGSDNASAVRGLYRFEKPVSHGGYLVVPHGSGYLIPSDCPDELPGRGPLGGFVGASWTLPLFGLVSKKAALCAIVDT